jgi:hypothetical protein
MNTSDLEKRIAEIEERNQRVEADKAWEISWVRIGSIVAITYIVAFVLLSVMNVERVWLSACVPAAGYILSTQSLPILKRWWMRRR